MRYAILLALFLVACASQQFPLPMSMRDGSPGNWSRDHGECVHQATYLASGYNWIGERIDKRAYYRCMDARGWTVEPALTR